MDIKGEYEDLTRKLKKILPFTALPIRELVQELRSKNHIITLKTELVIVDVYNSGDITGILCITESRGENTLACPLSQLIISSKHPLYKEIVDYQKKRIKRVQKLNQIDRY